jgi:hypothetical protein
LLPSILFNINLIQGKTNNIFVDEDRYYLFEGDLSGIGVEETINIILDKIKNNNVVLYVDTFWGHPDYINTKVNRLNKTKNSLSLKKTSGLSDNGIIKEVLAYPNDNKVLIFLTTTRNDIGFLSKQEILLLSKQFTRYQRNDGITESAYLFERK